MSLAATNLTFRTKTGAELVRGVSLAPEAGRLTIVLGPNGAGKTTLLRMLSGEAAPSEGEVTLNGRPLDKVDSEARARTLAVLPQAGSLTFPWLVEEVVRLGRLPHRRQSSARVDSEIVGKCLERVEVTHLAGRLYPTLSGGEKQRVHLARVLAQLEDGGDDLSGRVLLLDEPTSALDLAHQHQVLRTATRVAKRGAAVVAVLHDLNLAAIYGDHLVVMHQGEVVAEGNGTSVLTPELIHHVYGVCAVVQQHPTMRCPLVSTLGHREVEAAVN